MEHPLDYIRSLLGEEVTLVLRDRTEVSGELHMFDEHVNLMLGGATVEGKKREGECLFVRSDNILLILPKE